MYTPKINTQLFGVQPDLLRKWINVKLAFSLLTITMKTMAHAMPFEMFKQGEIGLIFGACFSNNLAIAGPARKPMSTRNVMYGLDDHVVSRFPEAIVHA